MWPKRSTAAFTAAWASSGRVTSSLTASRSSALPTALVTVSVLRPVATTAFPAARAALAILLTTVYNWLILVFGEPLKTTDLSAMLLQNDVAGGGKQCRPRHCFPYQKDWK